MGRSLTLAEVDIFDHIPQEVAERARLYRVSHLPPRAHGMTLGRRVMLLRGHESNRKLIAHELVHCAQYAEHGHVRFLVRYVADYVRNLVRLRDHRQAYLAITAEVDARAGAAVWVLAHPDLLDGS
ncbi:MAG TPA: DUF4157 domain-containing protein [Acidimicrobiales bacterium]